MSHFKTPFDKYVCMGDSITCEVGDITYTAYLAYDSDHSIDDDDMHSTDQSVTGVDDEQFARLMQNRQDYADGLWGYCGVILKAERDGWEKDYLLSLWGIEYNYPQGDNSYMLEVANELLDEYMESNDLIRDIPAVENNHSEMIAEMKAAMKVVADKYKK